jgi:hypothetical protein
MEFIPRALIVLLFCTPLYALDIPAIEQAAGAKGTWVEGEKAYKLTWPREDVQVKVDGQLLPPALGLTSWASIMGGKEKKAMLMGEIVCLANEVNPAIQHAQANGFDITALSNHYLTDEPRVFFLHIEGEGTEAHLAEGVRNVIWGVQAARRDFGVQPRNSLRHVPDVSKSSINPRPLEGVFKASGTSQDGIYRIEFPRTVTMPCACKASSAMGVATTATFAGSDDDAVVEGNFACVYGELQPTLTALVNCGSDMTITSIHNHMDGEAPRMIFIRYRAQGKAIDLAHVISMVLQAQEQSRPHVHNHAE